MDFIKLSCQNKRIEAIIKLSDISHVWENIFLQISHKCAKAAFASFKLFIQPLLGKIWMCQKYKYIKCIYGMQHLTQSGWHPSKK